MVRTTKRPSPGHHPDCHVRRLPTNLRPLGTMYRATAICRLSWPRDGFASWVYVDFVGLLSFLLLLLFLFLFPFLPGPVSNRKCLPSRLSSPATISPGTCSFIVPEIRWTTKSRANRCLDVDFSFPVPGIIDSPYSTYHLGPSPPTS